MAAWIALGASNGVLNLEFCLLLLHPSMIFAEPLLNTGGDSMWGRYFQNAELEKMVDQDLSRLYPQQLHPFFQTHHCQCIVKRILLLWCLAHPQYSYMQGMNELLTPLLYVLHIDTARLFEARTSHPDYFPDTFDTFFLPTSPLPEPPSPQSAEPYPEIHTFVLLGDAYGAEGDLGSPLSPSFAEHDAYSMLDALLAGAVVDFFSPAASPPIGPPPVIDASLGLYRLLSAADPALHAHLLALAVEPQYFSIRWLRLLFGREFSLSNLLLVWDRILAADASTTPVGFSEFRSGRGAFVAAVAVAMLVSMRRPLLASDDATACLQRLLSFPERIDVGPLLEAAEGIQAAALDRRPSPAAVSPGPVMLPGSYWEEQWKVVQGEEQRSGPRRRWSEVVRSSLAEIRSSARRNLLEDMSREVESEEDSVLGKVAGAESSGGDSVGILEAGSGGSHMGNREAEPAEWKGGRRRFPWLWKLRREASVAENGDSVGPDR